MALVFWILTPWIIAAVPYIMALKSSYPFIIAKARTFLVVEIKPLS
jgi:hypothetical protein